MFRKKNIALNIRPNVLDDNLGLDYNVLPSNSIYYGKFPYRLLFDKDIVFKNIPEHQNLNQYLAALRFEFNDFAGNFNNLYKFLTNSSLRIYISDYKDFLSTLAMYGDWVSEVSGPVSDEHLDLLYDTNIHLDIRPKLWYNKYEYKLDVWASFYAIRNFWISNIAGSNTKWHEKMKDDLDNFLEYVLSQEYNAKISGPGNYGRLNTATLFFNKDEFQEIMTFKNLMIPEYKTKITKAMI